MATGYTKICPECGAENDSNDLFCKNCGTSLAMVNAGNQQTAAFTPVESASETQTTTIAPSATPPPVEAGGFAGFAAAEVPEYQYVHTPQESSRGAVLGWLAATLMLIVIAAFVWSTVISDSTRESITGIF